MPYRVILWTTGRIGAVALTGIVEHPELELVGVYAHSPAKAGIDAAALGHRPVPPTGIVATADVDALLALDADCVCYMPAHGSIDEVCRILASGKNVVATPFLFYAEALPPEERERVRAACLAGNSAVYGTGVNPGFAGGILPLALSGMNNHVERITVYEQTNWSNADARHMTFDNMRFGAPREAATLAANPFAGFCAGLYLDQVHLLADALGLALDEVTLEQDLVIATREHRIRTGVIAAGTVCGQRYLWQGRRDGVVRIEADCLFSVGADYPAHWPPVASGWTVAIEGDPASRTHFAFAGSFERELPMAAHAAAGSTTTAMLAVNAIPNLCRAPAGIRGAHDLGLVMSGRGFR